jgi:hypothetical protein
VFYDGDTFQIDHEIQQRIDDNVALELPYALAAASAGIR